MITTAEPILQQVSNDLREVTTDTDSRRISFFNSAVRHILGLFKWSWSRVSGTLTVEAGTQTYDLTAAFTDYSPLRGVYEVYVDGAKIGPASYERRTEASNNGAVAYYLTPDGKTIGFTSPIVGTEFVTIWAYRRHTNVTTAATVLNIPLPDEMANLIAAYMLFLEHRSKKQRNDARNAMIDFKDLLDDLRPQDASSKIKDAPKTIPPFLSYLGHRRRYRN